MEPPFFFFRVFPIDFQQAYSRSNSHYITLIQATRGGHLFLIFISLSFLGFEGGIHHYLTNFPYVVKHEITYNTCISSSEYTV